jgi:pyochelin synthetase
VVLLAAYAEVLAQWSRGPQFTLNLTLFNGLPLHPQVNDIVGDFTSVTLLAVDHTQPQAFQIRAKGLQQQLWQDLEQRYFSGVRVLRALTQSQAGGGQAGMPVVFTSVVGGVLEKGPRWLGQVTYSLSQTPQVWIDNQAEEQEEALLLMWDAVEALFPEGMLADMFQAYVGLLQRLATEPSAWTEPTGPLLPATQLARRAAVNATAAPVHTKLAHELFAEQVRQRPQQVAVVAAGRTLTYAELARRANQVGRQLRALGARPNQLVAVVMEKGWEQVVAVLGVLASGAAYLPVDPALPPERLRYLLEHGEVALGLTQSWLEAQLPWPKQVQRLRLDMVELHAEHEAPLEPAQRSEDLAYVIYTSGSTGIPKGVMIEHRSMVNRTADVNRRFGIGPEDRVLALTAPHHDLFVYDIFGVLAAGGTIIMPDASAARDPAHWAQLMVQEQVTLWNSVSAFMELLVEYLENAPDRSQV